MTPGDDSGRRPSGLSRRRLLAGIGGVGAVGMASGIGTGAYLSDRETFPNNVFGAGEVGLTVDDEITDGTVTVGPFAVDRTTFDGRPDPERFEIGASANPVRVWLATECPDGDRLGNALEVEVVVDGESLTGGYRPLVEVERLLATGVRIDGGCLAAGPDGGSIAVEVAPYLPAGSPDVGGETTELTFRLYAEQCRHISEEQASAPGANPFAVVACEETCVPCEDENGTKVGTLTLRYLGDDPATVAVVATSGGAGGVGAGGTKVFNGEVPPDGTFVVDGAASPTNDPGWIGPNIYVDDGAESADDTDKTLESDDEGNGNAGGNGNGNRGGNGNNGNGSGNGNNGNRGGNGNNGNGAGNGNNGNGGGNGNNRNNGRDNDGKAGGDRPEGVKIHTSCSDPLRIGDVYGGRYEVVAATTTDGEPLCGTEAN